jgi:hypothetical protein
MRAEISAIRADSLLNAPLVRLIWRQAVSPRNAAYASPATSPARENASASQTTTMRYDSGCDAGWSSQVARRAHNPEVAGSNPAPATGKALQNGAFRLIGFLTGGDGR